nr:MAG TPA: hypothetical protein [Bacteriophage sp.]
MRFLYKRSFICYSTCIITTLVCILCLLSEFAHDFVFI